MEPGDYYDAPISKVLQFVRNAGLIRVNLKGKHNRSAMVVVQGPDVARPSYIDTYIHTYIHTS
jgi:hypothetical protein